MEIKMTPQAIRSQEKKQHIFEVTMKLFETYGYRQTTIKEICTAAGITSGTFYNFYGDKRSILMEYRNHLVSDKLEYISLAPAHIASPFQAICDYYYASLCSNDRFPKLLSIEIHSELKLAHLEDAYSPSAQSPFREVRMLLCKAAEAGVLTSKLTPNEIAEYINFNMLGLVEYWHYCSADESMTALANRMLPIIFAAVTDEPIQLRTIHDNT